MKRLVLASASPRRSQYLKYLGVDFEVIVPNVDESVLLNEAPSDLVARLSLLKAQAVSSQLEGEAVVIAADTVVAFENKILGKPKDADDAFAMLKMLQGRTHEVFTGTTITDGQKVENFVVATKVTFAPLSDSLIRTYIQSGECFDKAGAYALQGIASMLIQKVEGSVSTVVGLPICEVRKALEEFSILPQSIRQENL